MKKNGEFVGVDDKYIPENEKYVDDSIIGNKEESARKTKKVAKGIGIAYLCFFGIFAAFVIGMTIFGFTMSKNLGKDIKVSTKHEFSNGKFELYSGTSSRGFVTALLDNVVTNNKTNSDKIITVIYNTTSTTEPNEIVKLKKSFEQGKDYEVMLDYDTNGCVNKVTIEDI